VFAIGLSNLLIFIAILGGLILIHELGHLLVGIRCGVQVKEFGLGLPPRLFKMGSVRGTDITLNWIPLGGFVLFEGEFDSSTPVGLASKTPLSRLAILSAGSICNLTIGYLLLVFMFVAGWPDRINVLDVQMPSPAYSAGLEPMDKILQINGKQINSNIQLRDEMAANAGEPVILGIERGNERLSLHLTPRTVWPEGQGPAGFTSTMEIVRYPLNQAFMRALDSWILHVQELVSLPIRFLNHQIQPDEVRLVSPIGLKQISDQAIENAESWDECFPILNFVAAISIALGLTNLLPLPALDGGRMFFVLVEVVRGKAVDAKCERVVHGAGLVALLSLMFVLIIQDIIHPLL
jgi:regulator of sigma E protease